MVAAMTAGRTSEQTTFPISHDRLTNPCLFLNANNKKKQENETAGVPVKQTKMYIYIAHPHVLDTSAPPPYFSY